MSLGISAEFHQLILEEGAEENIIEHHKYQGSTPN